MQKKIIALAIAGLASTAAFAQSNVTIYGSVDYGYSYRYDARTPNNFKDANSASTLDSGIAQGNRLGFKGVEDLGNGLKAVFLLESGFGIDTGASAQGGLLFGRQAYAGLTGGFGTLVGGRLYTPYYSLMLSIDPFANGTVGAYGNVYGADQDALLDPQRVNNAAAYISPSFGGFTVTGAYSNNALSDETVNSAVGATTAVTNGGRASNAHNNTVYAVVGKYEGGPVMAALSYHNIQMGSAGTPPAAGAQVTQSYENYTLGGAFDAKVVKISAAYTHSTKDRALSATDVKLDNYLIAAAVPIGKVTLKGSYIFSDGNSAACGNAQQYALGANYNLSKRTDLYTAYSLIDNDSVKASATVAACNRAAATNDGSNSGYAAGATGTAGSVPYQQGFTVGVRHTF
jgi:predicted porin